MSRVAIIPLFLSADALYNAYSRRLLWLHLFPLVWLIIVGSQFTGRLLFHSNRLLNKVFTLVKSRARDSF